MFVRSFVRSVSTGPRLSRTTKAARTSAIANPKPQSFVRQAARPAAARPLAFRAPIIPFLTQHRLISDETRKAIENAVGAAPVVLFMKGTPETPQCGFSRASIQILGLQGVDPNKFAAFNVLADPELRQGTNTRACTHTHKSKRWFDRGRGGTTADQGATGIKEFSDWPTIPQLYVDKEFIGGCDILVSMHQNGELAKLLEEKKVLVEAESENKE